MAALLGVSILGVVVFSTCAVCATKSGTAKKGGRVAAEGTRSVLGGDRHSSTAVPRTKSRAPPNTGTECVSEEDVEKFVVLRGIPGMELARGELAQLWKMTELELRLHVTTASRRLDDVAWLVGQWKMKIKDQELLKFDVEKQQKSRAGEAAGSEEVTSQSHKCHEQGTFFFFFFLNSVCPNGDRARFSFLAATRSLVKTENSAHFPC